MSNELQTRYLDAVNYLDDNFAYFLTHVLNIGRPKSTTMVPTAAVTVPHASKNIDDDFGFLFNLDFAKTLSDQEMGFILGHETMHILLNHLKLFKRDEFAWSSTCTNNCKANFKGRVPAEGASLCHECQRLQQKANIAADCVINDFLVGRGMTPPDGLCLGENLVGYDAAHSTVSQVFRDLKDEDIEKFFKCDGSCQPGGSGQPCDGSCGKGGRSIDDHGWMRQADNGQEEAADKLSEKNPHMPGELSRIKDDDDYKSKMAPPGKQEGGKQGFTENKDVSLKWAELLEKVNPFAFKQGPKPRASWHRSARKMAALPQSRLPVYAEGKTDIGSKKPAIVMALDTSGSIGQEEANQFVNMARSVPQQKCKLHVCTFTTQYRELDLDEPEWNSGGTHFDCISSYIEEVVMPANNKRYPSAVVVFTDGQATFSSKRPDDKQAKGWWWLLTYDTPHDYGRQAFPGHRELLANYTKGK